MVAKTGDTMKGLTNFISDIRNCKSKESEVKRIQKELANIRGKFKSDKGLEGYQKKKYVCKLLFMFLLGQEIDFGYQEAINLMASIRYSEKHIGYLYVSVLGTPSEALSRSLVNAIKNHIRSRIAINVSLALQAVANIGSEIMAQELGSEIPSILMNRSMDDYVRQNAALSWLKLIRLQPALFIGSIEEYGPQLAQLLNDKNLGVVTSSLGLLQEMAIQNSTALLPAVNNAVNRLSKLVLGQPTEYQDYSYHFVVAPWLTVKLLKFIQHFPPPEDPLIRSRLTEALDTILTKMQEPPQSKKIYHSNAKNGILFEAIYLIIHLENENALLIKACNHIGTYMQHKEANLRYLAIESMVQLGTSEICHSAVVKHLETVLNTLKTDRDISIRQRCADLLYSMCDHSNAENIISELLTYLEKADYAIREELVLKIAILAEKFASDFLWYVNMILNLIRVGGDYVSEEVWHRVIQIVINREDIQGHAAKLCFEALQAPSCHETMLKVGGYILGEFGNLIAGDHRSSAVVQFKLLHSKYFMCSPDTRALLLSTYMKFMNLFPEIRPAIQSELNKDNQMRNANVELQQRAVEYLSLSKVGNNELLAKVLEEMPPFPEKESSLMAKLKKKQPTVPIHKEDKMASAGSSDSLQHHKDPSPQPSTLLQVATFKAPTIEASSVAVPSLVELGNNINSENAPKNNLVDLVTSQNENISPLVKSVVEVKSTFLTKNNGILFENDLIQIGIKSEYKTSFGQINIFYGNKSGSIYTNFSVGLSLDTETNQALHIQPKSNPPSSIASSAQEQQILVLECKDYYENLPVLEVKFAVNNQPQEFTLPLPIFLTKFLEGTQMNQQEFFTRWKALVDDKESQKIFQANYQMNRSDVIAKLSNAGFAYLADIDPNPSNYVAAGIIQIKGFPSGVLLRLEPNEQTLMYRLTVRSSKAPISKILTNLLSDQL